MKRKSANNVESSKMKQKTEKSKDMIEVCYFYLFFIFDINYMSGQVRCGSIRPDSASQQSPAGYNRRDSPAQSSKPAPGHIPSPCNNGQFAAAMFHEDDPLASSTHEVLLNR